jgi:phage shock protein A
MEISVELIGLIGVIALVVIIMIMMSIKDSETSKKLSRYEQSIDNLAQQNHTLRKEILQLVKNRDKFMDEMEETLEGRVKEQVQQSVYPLIESMREIENVMQSFQDEQVGRIDKIEERRNEINYIPKNANISNEKLIIAQYSQGKSEALIAKDLRIGIGEVDLVLKLANLK